MIQSGTTVAGYRVERMIGRGGMGVVYEAVQTSLQRRVALKVLRPELAEDPDFVARFRREGRLQASLEHPHVLDVYEVGESEAGLFLAMRLVAGQNLLDLMRDDELDAERTLTLLDQVTGALDAAHDAGLIHRDVKPQNVLVGDGDRAFLADFGLTRGSTDTTAVTSRPMLGSVAYVAPEIVRGEEPTPASDRYSFAATLFHCLTGDVVFPRGSDAAVLYAHTTEPPPSAGERRAALPPELDDVFGSALAKQPSARPATAQAIIRAARDALGPSAGSLGSPRFAGPHDPVVSTGAASPAPFEQKGISPRIIASVCVVLVAAAALGAAVALSIDEDQAVTDEVALTAVPQRAEALGSDLAVPERSVDCRGQAATPSSPACSIVQSGLPGAEILVPADGAIVGWTVRGAQGEMALDVIRPRGEETVRVGRSQWEFAGNTGPHTFRTRLPVEAGDQIGVELGPGASIGVSEVEGASTQRWFEPTGGAYGAPDRARAPGLDYELALRAEFVPGAQVGLPAHLTGSEAANAPAGRVRDQGTLGVDEPQPERLGVELVQLADRVALDVLSRGRRTLRVFMPDLEPGGIPVELKLYEYPGEPFGEADVWWVNPNGGRLNFQFLILGKGRLEGAG